jgi:hypothetical protein
MTRKSDIKRHVEILKSRDEFDNRLRQMRWQNPTGDSKFRLECLVQFHPDKSDRQIFNHARASIHNISR